MNQEEEDAKKSLCWNCKFGICIRESEIEKMIHPAMNEEPGDIFEQSQKDEMEMVEHTIEHKQIKTICYWRPENIQQSPPILMSKVEQCNRYENR